MKKTIVFLSLVLLYVWLWGALVGQQKNQDSFNLLPMNVLEIDLDKKS